MMTRNPQLVPIDVGKKSSTTEFQFRQGKQRNIIDLTEARLRKLVPTHVYAQVLLDNYLEAKVAIAWRAGKPVYVYIVRD